MKVHIAIHVTEDGRTTSYALSSLDSIAEAVSELLRGIAPSIPRIDETLAQIVSDSADLIYDSYHDKSYFLNHEDLRTQFTETAAAIVEGWRKHDDFLSNN